MPLIPNLRQYNNARNPNADPELIATLGRLVACEDLEEGGTEEAQDDTVIDERPMEASDQETEDISNETRVESAVQAGDEITDSEFEQLVDAVSDVPKTETTESKASGTDKKADSDEITDDEFEDLLDQLHGKGHGPGSKSKSVASTEVSATNPEPKEPSTPVNTDSNIITDDEFEDLLDQLHGKGKGPGVNPAVSAQSKSEAVSEPSTTEPKAPGATKKPKAAKPAPKKEPAKSTASSAPAKDVVAPPTETTVRVDTQRLDDIMNMVGELVLVRNRLVRLGDKSTDESLGKAVANLDVVTADLQTSVMKTRMQPIKKVFGRFPRVVRDLARNLKKEINLELVGEETDLDKNLVEALADPLVHLVRNSVDHGIESPEVRESNHKPRIGKVILAAQQEGDHILLSITDDGGGMDAQKLRGIAVEKGLMDEDAAQRLSDKEAFNLIFAPGFSTKTEISDVSGRGVGMDVVKTKITQLNGSIEIESELGKGTEILIKVPLTLAIMPTLMIMLGAQAFALPLVSVNEIFHMDLKKINIVDGQECVSIREQAIPLFYLKNWLVNGAANQEKPTEAHVVIVTVGTQRVGFVVDQLIGQEEVVIKPLGKMLNGTPGMAGATITGDGTIALILDVPSMLKRYAGTV